MRSRRWIGLALFFFVLLPMSGPAQTSIITTYAGPHVPEDSLSATAVVLDCPTGVTPDGTGGFYFSVETWNRVYRVATDGTIHIVAGAGISGFSGDGGPATSAQLSSPWGVAIDGVGNLYIADKGNHSIRKVTVDGTITTVAGNGIGGFSGDDGPATAAQLNEPRSVTVDTAGNLYIADTGNHRIRIVTVAGIIRTVAGNGTRGFGGDGGPATAAQMSYPRDVALDEAGNLYIADYANNSVRIVTAGGIISTLAARINGPQTIAVDAAGNLYITEYASDYVRKVTAGGLISTVAGNGAANFGGDGGPATSAALNSPGDVAVDAAGNLYIADENNYRIRVVNAAGIITTVAGEGISGYSGDGGPATFAQLNQPTGGAIDSADNLYIADSENNRVRKVTADGIISTVAGGGSGGDGGPATSALLNRPHSVAVDAAGNLYIADTGNFRIRKVTADGTIQTVAGDPSSTSLGDGGPATSADLGLPLGVAVDAAGNLYIADGQFRVRKVTVAGIITTVAGNGTEGFSGDGGPATQAQLGHTAAVAVDAAGNLYILAGYRVRKVNPAGVISTVAGNGTSGFGGDGGPATDAQFADPQGLAADPAGNLYIAEAWYAASRIRKITASGIISTVAGNLNSGFSGDGGPATSAQLNQPNGVTVDAVGNLYIADTFNHRIRKVAAGPSASRRLTLTSGGVTTAVTSGEGENIQAGFATLKVDSGVTPYGTAVFRFKQNGVTVSEVGIPASPPTKAALIFIDYRSDAPAVPGRTETGKVDITTGLAVINCGLFPTNITFTLRDITGATLSTGHGSLAPGHGRALLIDQLKDMASDFALPPDFQNSIQFASLEISGDQPLSILALRLTINQRDEVLLTTTPVADLAKPPTASPIYFPQFLDGGGYTTSLILLNTSNSIETGILEFLDDNGAPFVVSPVGDAAGHSFRYSIPPGGTLRFQTDGSPADVKVGWAQLTPDPGTSTPIGSGVFSYNPQSVLVTDSGIPSAAATTHARVYVDLSGNHNTGLAIANVADAGAGITIKAYRSDGVTAAGTSGDPLVLAGRGHGAKFANEFVRDLPSGFTGVLEISSPTPFAALTLRSLQNERNEFLVTTFPVADANRAAPSPVIFPRIVDGGGYATQFILISSGGASSATINFYSETGAPLPVGK